MRKLPLMFLLVCLFFVSAQVLAVPPTKFSVDVNHSTVGFTIPILNGVSSVRGKFTEFAVDVDYDEADITKSTVTAKIKAASIDTGVEGRDKHLRNPDFFDVEKYPEITFQSTRIVKKGKGFVAIGNFTMHGVTKEISIPFTVNGKFVNPTNQATLIGFTGNVSINRRDYGINWQHSSIQNWVGDVVKIELTVLLRAARPQ